MKVYFAVMYNTDTGYPVPLNDGIWENVEEAEAHVSMKKRQGSRLDYFVSELHVTAEEQEVLKERRNMRIWSALGKTELAHTKQFTCAGGLRGTAVKPQWANMRMTEFFGPCGIGWGHTEPQFQTVTAGDEILVYCTALWYRQDEKTFGVYGVGGDKVLTQIFGEGPSGQQDQR